MKLKQRSMETVKNIIQYFVTFFLLLSFVFLAIITGLNLLSNSAYKKFVKGNKIYVRRKNANKTK
ncbi:hypothetical protein [Fusibacter bizertensis]